MYIYFNNEGRITTKIPHGEIIRQGNPLNLYICVADNFFNDADTVLDWTTTVKLVYPDGKVSNEFIPNSLTPVRKKFFKLKDSEVTFDLVHNKRYYTYIFNIDAENSTVIPGDLSLVVKLYNTKNERSYYQENVNAFVEYTTGYNRPASTITQNQYNAINNNINLLCSQIAKLAEKLDVLSVSFLPPIITDDTSENYNIDKIYVLNGDYIEIDRIPEIHEILSNFVYKINGRYYKLIKPESDDDEVSTEEIEDFEDTIGYIYKTTETGYILINRDISEITGSKQKIQEANILYGTDENSSPYLAHYSKNIIPRNIVQRDENGQIKVNMPIADDDSVNKKYVDDYNNNFKEYVDNYNNDFKEYVDNYINYFKEYVDNYNDNFKKYVDTNFVINTKQPNKIYGTNEKGENITLSHEDLQPSIILKYPHSDDFPVIGDFKKFYISEYDGIMYYWDGTDYKEISSGADDFDVIDGGNA